MSGADYHLGVGGHAGAGRGRLADPHVVLIFQCALGVLAETPIRKQTTHHLPPLTGAQPLSRNSGLTPWAAIGSSNDHTGTPSMIEILPAGTIRVSRKPDDA
jgi:hypothetical protein